METVTNIIMGILFAVLVIVLSDIYCAISGIKKKTDKQIDELRAMNDKLRKDLGKDKK